MDAPLSADYRRGSAGCQSLPHQPTVRIRENLKTLSPAERLELIGAVWETLSPADAPVTAEEKVLLDARLAALDNSPEDQSPWSEVQARLRRQLP